MGYFDNVKIMFGRGMNAADRKTQELRLQADLSRISASLESAYNELGKIVYTHPTLAAQVRKECPSEYDLITEQLTDAQDIRDRINELQRQTAATTATATYIASPTQQVTHFACPACGAPVTLDSSYCFMCGDNLAALKQQYRFCPNCGTYHTADSLFCMDCGSQTTEIPVAASRSKVASVVKAREMSEEIEDVSTLSTGVPDTAYVVTMEESKPAPENCVDTAVPFTSNREEQESSDPPTPSVDGPVTPIPAILMPDITSRQVIDAAPVDASPSAVPYAPVASAVKALPTCPNCGSVVELGDVFCGECGARLLR